MSTQNDFQQVQTMQDIMLAKLQNKCGILNRANKKFKDFPSTIIGNTNLGPTVNIYKPVRVTSANTLNWQLQGTNQIVQPLTIDFQISSAVAWTQQDMIENVDPFDFMTKVGDSMITEIGSKFEQKLALDFVKYPYRFYVVQQNTYGELATAAAQFQEYGAAPGSIEAFIPMMTVPQIINTGSNQFTIDRNNEATRKWQLGEFAEVNWNSSNQLQIHRSGTEGTSGSTLTVVSTTKNANGAILSMVVSGCSAANDANSIKQYDRGYFLSSTARMLQYSGYNESENAIQFVVASNAASNGSSQVTITFETPLYPGESTTEAIAINQDITAGMTLKMLGSFKAGVIYSGNPHMLAMPQMGSLSPFASAYRADPETGASIQMGWGANLGVNDSYMKLGAQQIMGSTLFREYALTLIYLI
jgi:hypothetical protein